MHLFGTCFYIALMLSSRTSRSRINAALFPMEASQRCVELKIAVDVLQTHCPDLTRRLCRAYYLPGRITARAVVLRCSAVMDLVSVLNLLSREKSAAGGDTELLMRAAQESINGTVAISQITAAHPRRARALNRDVLLSF